MTGEELRDYVEEQRNLDVIPYHVYSTLIDGIDGLEQESDSDCISRQAVDELLKSLVHTTRDKADFLCNFWEGLQKLRPVTPQSKTGNWIPVSEGSPKESGNYWCTFGGTNLAGSDHYTTESDAKKLFDEPEEYAGWRSQNVVAWMPLPETYKAGKEE